MSEQEIFDKVKAHLLTQNCRSENLEGHCLYRGPDGLKCAIGCLISDSEYSPNFERHGVYNEILNFVAPGISRYFLNDLQSIHDMYEPYMWERQLNFFATKHGLRT